jgi:para-aminobenzoate synthetase component I
VSIKKINFSPEFSRLSAWGHNKAPFFALVDFDGNLLAEPLKQSDFTIKSGIFQGRMAFGAGHLRFSLNFAPHHSGQRSQLGNSMAALKVIHPPEKAQIVAAIRNLQKELGEGYSYLVNICSQTTVSITATPAALFEASRAPFTVWLENEFLSFSPEAFVSVVNDTITTMPMKGTGFDAKALLADTKEQAEHATIVDLLRNDLGRVARDIRIGRYRYLAEIPRGERVLYQTSTEIQGTMASDWRSCIGEWLPQLLPAGSISGAPKKKTVELIRAHETEPRGFFTGIAALFDGENFYSCVLIRFLDLTGDTLKFRSGAGITIYSDPEAEYQEILHKVYLPV